MSVSEHTVREYGPAGLAGCGDGRSYWYALYLRPCWEKRVATILSAQSLEVYLPTHRVWSRRAAAKDLIEEPVFPGYLFVRCVLTKETWLTIQKTNGVVRILGSDAGPTPIPDWEIDSLRMVLAAKPNIMGHPRLRKGSLVRVVKGPLRGTIGTLVEVARNRHRLVVSVEVINRAVAITIDASVVQAYDL